MQSYIITAYKNPEYLIHLVDSITERKDEVYIHIDAKSDIRIADLSFENPEHVHVYKLYKINWGSYNHLRAIIYLLRQVNNSSDYVHIISGQDILIRNKEEFDEKFKNCNQAFMSCSSVDDVNMNVRQRLEGYNLFPNSDSRLLRYRIINRLMRGLRHVVKRESKVCQIGEFENVYKGVVWSSLPYEQVAYVLNYIDVHPEFLAKLKHTLIPEEFFFQTILMNSRYRDMLVADPLRYTLWQSKHGSIPAILDESDYNGIVSSNCFFARKIVPTLSDKLTSMIDANLRT